MPRYKGVRSVVSVAYPIICYPDSPYWHYVSFFPSSKKKLVNALRRKRIRSAEKVVVETEVMAGRINRYVGVAKQKIQVIPPSPSEFLPNRPFSPRTASVARILLLSGVDLHKNLWRLPAIAAQLSKKTQIPFLFRISVTKEQFLSSTPKFIELESEILERYFEFFGAVPAEDIGAVYSDSDLLLNASDLESFSNNYMEAWKAGLPLVCSDTDFSRHICGNSAVYIDPHDAESAAERIASLLESNDMQSSLVSEGKSRLHSLPDSIQKFDLIWSALKNDID